MKKHKITLADIGIVVGILLVVASVAILIFSSVGRQTAAQDAKKIVTELRTLMPEVHTAVSDDRINMTMPAMEIDSESFCGILEVPKYSTELPVHETWQKSRVGNYPCKYTGSLYDGSLIIGGIDYDGQLDFAKKIQNDDTVFFTDMVGGRYAYTVTDIRRSKDVSTEYLTSIDADLVLFIKNSLSLDYTVIRCNFDTTN